jgi:hypothetical protein
MEKSFANNDAESDSIVIKTNLVHTQASRKGGDLIAVWLGKMLMHD